MRPELQADHDLKTFIRMVGKLSLFFDDNLDFS